MRKTDSVAFENISTISNVPLSTKAADIIRDMIVSGQCPMGFRFLEEEFAKALNVSRASIRAAAIVLEGEGLLIRSPNKATHVVVFTKKDIENIYSLRNAVERCCLRNAMQNGTIDIEELKRQADSVNRIYESSEPETRLEWIRADMYFHELIAAQSGNAYAYDVWKSLKYKMLTALNTAASKLPEGFIPTGDGYDSHTHLVRLIENGDVEGALDSLSTHIMTGAGQIASILE